MGIVSIKYFLIYLFPVTNIIKQVPFKNVDERVILFPSLISSIILSFFCLLTEDIFALDIVIFFVICIALIVTHSFSKWLLIESVTIKQ